MPTSGWTLIRFAWASHSLVIMLTMADKTLNSGCAQLGEAPQKRTPIVRFKMTQTCRLSCTTPPQMNLKVARSGLPHVTPQNKTWQGAPRFEPSEPRFMLIGGVRGVPSEVHRMRSSSMGAPVEMHPHVTSSQYQQRWLPPGLSGARIVPPSCLGASHGRAGEFDCARAE